MLKSEENQPFSAESQDNFAIGVPVYRLIYNGNESPHWRLQRYKTKDVPESIGITDISGLDALLAGKSNCTVERKEILDKITSYEGRTPSVYLCSNINSTSTGE